MIYNPSYLKFKNTNKVSLIKFIEDAEKLKKILKNPDNLDWNSF